MAKLLNLKVMGARWYAEVQDGAWTQSAPTRFGATMPREDVLAAIKLVDPLLEISDKARKG